MMRVFLTLGSAVVLAAMPAHAQAPSTSTDAAATAESDDPVDPRAIEALKRMSSYLQSMDTFRLTATTSLDVVTVNNQKVQLDSVTRYEVKKPGIMIDLASDQKSRQFFYDGKQFTIYAPLMKYYATVPAPPTNREFIEALHKRTGIELPLEDLFRWANAEQQADIDKLTSAFNVGTATIDGAVTDHWAFRSDDFDWEVWIQQGDQPLPRKYVLIDRTDPTLPAYSARLAWEVNPTLDPATFTFVPGPGAIAIQIDNSAEEVAQ